MVIHNWNHHDGTRSLNFRMEEIKTFVKPPDRPLDEALRINNSEADIIINSGAEWRLDAIPRVNFTAFDLKRRRAAMRELYLCYCMFEIF